MPKAQKMIFIDRHVLFSHIAHAGSGLDHPATQDWWARRAIASFTAHLIQEATDATEIESRLQNCRIRLEGLDEDLWSRLYRPQFIASISAVEMAVQRDIPVYVAYWQAATEDQDDVFDWLIMLARENHRLLGKLPRITWPQAVVHARNWKDAKERHTTRSAGTEGTTEILILGKYKWFRLDTIEAIGREGDVMRNCLGDGQFDYIPAYPGRAEYDGLYSLRDGNGISIITALHWRGEISQSLERYNRPVRQQFVPLIDALAAHVRTNLETSGARSDSGEKE